MDRIEEFVRQALALEPLPSEPGAQQFLELADALLSLPALPVVRSRD